VGNYLERLRAAAAAGAGYDVAILDMQMPVMTGLELAHAIKADPAIAGVRLIILSSIGDHDLAAESRAAGVDACLTKPTRQSELYDCLARVMAPGSHQELSQTDTPSAAVARPHNGARILVAEDSLVNQAVARGLLVSLGYTVDLVANGLEAIEATERTAYHAILMDCQMPKMDGYEAARTIRAQEGGRARVPIIALTADVLADARTKSLAAGMDDYLTKPINADALAAALDRLVPVTKGPTAPPKGVDPSGPLDRAVLGQLHKLEATTPGLMDNVIGLFLDEMPPRLNDLRDAMLEADLRKMARLAHAMKGSAANLGARSLAALCSDVEARAKAGTGAASGAQIDDLEREFGRVREALQAKAWVA
jgi:two-component system sensor histidine kinase/response regulator